MARTGETRTAKPSKARTQAFNSTYSVARGRLDDFVQALLLDDPPENEDEITAGLVDASGNVLLGVWLELHRIADALETIAQPLADMIEEHHA